MAKSSVSDNCMENMERFVPIYAIAYAIVNSMENLRFDKEGYLDVLVFYDFSVLPYVIETLVEICENSK